MEPRKRYQIMSLSRRAYSARSSCADRCGTRRKLRASSSIMSTTMSGFVRRFSRASIVAVPVSDKRDRRTKRY